MGMPPLNGFVGEVLILEGVYPVSAWWAAGVAGGILLGAAYLLWLYQRTVFSETKPTGMADLRPLEAVTMAPFVIGIVWIGLQPGWLLGWFAQPVSAILGSR
jgi:NADH-quinone oxidoreductase subunit M